MGGGVVVDIRGCINERLAKQGIDLMVCLKGHACFHCACACMYSQC